MIYLSLININTILPWDAVVKTKQVIKQRLIPLVNHNLLHKQQTKVLKTPLKEL